MSKYLGKVNETYTSASANGTKWNNFEFYTKVFTEPEIMALKLISLAVHLPDHWHVWDLYSTRLGSKALAMRRQDHHRLNKVLDLLVKVTKSQMAQIVSRKMFPI